MIKEALHAKLQKAFKGIHLEDGIGYFEADALDDYLAKDSKEYLEYKIKDIRSDWEIAAESFKDWKGANTEAYCFMDIKGLLYHLPIFMCNEIFYDLLDYLIVEIGEHSQIKEDPATSRQPYYIGLLDLLSKEQLDCLIYFYRIRLDEKIEKAKTPFTCQTCGKVHIPWVKWNGVSAKNYVANGFSDVYRVHQFLMRYMNTKTDKNQHAT
ncbi:MAG: hypothetical protein WBP13_10105 [Methylophilaceae bacterium]